MDRSKKILPLCFSAFKHYNRSFLRSSEVSETALLPSSIFHEVSSFKNVFSSSFFSRNLSTKVELKKAFHNHLCFSESIQHFSPALTVKPRLPFFDEKNEFLKLNCNPFLGISKSVELPFSELSSKPSLGNHLAPNNALREKTLFSDIKLVQISYGEGILSLARVDRMEASSTKLKRKKKMNKHKQRKLRRRERHKNK